MSCWPPPGTPDGSKHVLYQIIGDRRFEERAIWHAAETPYWTRWCDERPTGDFAELCGAVYGYPLVERGDETHAL